MSRRWYSFAIPLFEKVRLTMTKKQRQEAARSVAQREALATGGGTTDFLPADKDPLNLPDRPESKRPPMKVEHPKQTQVTRPEIEESKYVGVLQADSGGIPRPKYPNPDLLKETVEGARIKSLDSKWNKK